MITMREQIDPCVVVLSPSVKLVMISGTISRPEDLLQYIDKDQLGNHLCMLCNDFKHKSRANVRNHVESKHFTNLFVYECDVCGKTAASQQALHRHKSSYHKPVQRIQT